MYAYIAQLVLNPSYWAAQRQQSLSVDPSIYSVEAMASVRNMGAGSQRSTSAGSSSVTLEQNFADLHITGITDDLSLIHI